MNVAEQIGLKMAKSKWLEAQHALKRNSLGKNNPHMHFNTLHSAPRFFCSRFTPITSHAYLTVNEIYAKYKAPISTLVLGQ